MRELDAITQIVLQPDMAPSAPLQDDDLSTASISSERLEALLGSKIPNGSIRDVQSIMFKLSIIHAFLRDNSRSRKTFSDAVRNSLTARPERVGWSERIVRNPGVQGARNSE